MGNAISFGMPGHEFEFCVNFAEYDLNEYIPERYARYIDESLIEFGFSVMNRGSRIEILPPMGMWKDMREGDIEFVFDIIKSLFTNRVFTTRFRL